MMEEVAQHGQLLAHLDSRGLLVHLARMGHTQTIYLMGFVLTVQTCLMVLKVSIQQKAGTTLLVHTSVIMESLQWQQIRCV